MFVQPKVSADRKIEYRVRLDEPAFEVHAVKNLLGKLTSEIRRRFAGFKLDREAAVVPAAACRPEVTGQVIIHKLNDERVALVFLDIDSRTGWPLADINRFAQE